MALGLVTSIFQSSAPTVEQQGQMITNTANLVSNALSNFSGSINAKEEIASRLTDTNYSLNLHSKLHHGNSSFA